MLLLSIALADEAIVGFQTAKQIYEAPLRNESDAVRYRWKTFMQNLPILRRDNFGVFTEYPARYGTMSEHWRRLVQGAGYQDPASWYALRRACGNEIHCKSMSSNLLMMLINSVSAPQSILMQVMGHKDPQIFGKHYRSQNVLWDTQNAYLKTPLDTKLVHMAGNTNSLNRDSRAPTKLTDEQEMSMVHANPEVAEKQRKVQDLAAACVRSCGSVREAARRQFPIHRQYMKAYNEHISEKRYRRKEALKNLRNKFFEGNCFESIEQSSDLNHELSSKKYALPERASLVKLLFEEVMTKQDLFVQRLAATEAMHALCNAIEPVPKSMPQKSLKHRFPENFKKIKHSLRCQPKTCLFCLAKSGDRVLSTRSRLTRHLEKLHYPNVKGKSFVCPHPHCNERLRHIHHFQVHAMQVHGIEFTKKCGMSFQQPLEEVCDGLAMP